MRCSFCNKSQGDVLKLIAGPNVFICDECVEVCAKIIDDDPARSLQGEGSPSPAWKRPPRHASATTVCSLCGGVVAEHTTLVIPDRGVLCGECADIVDDALSRGRPIE